MYRALTIVATLFMALCSSASYGNVTITVDKSTQRMLVAVDGQARYTWPVSTGRRGYDTPAGSYRAFRMEKDHFSKEWDDAPMPHSIFFTPKGHAIHGSYETRRLGSPASHGCIRLAPGNAAKLFELVKSTGVSNTKVIVTGAIAPRRSAPRPQLEPVPLGPQIRMQQPMPEYVPYGGYPYSW